MFQRVVSRIVAHRRAVVGIQIASLAFLAGCPSVARPGLDQTREAEVFAQQITDEQRQMSGYNAQYQFWMQRGQSDKATASMRGMYMATARLEAMYGKEYADQVFEHVTGARNRRAFFRSMGVTEQDGAMTRSRRRTCETVGFVTTCSDAD